jgi:hypothetical protein
LWKAEKWDPDRLMSLYQKAGAKYFVSMGSHHDNFFLWNSKLHRWNAVNMGPHRDVVGEWQKAAQKYGLKFGVSEHLGASFTWFQSSHRADREGPKAGVPYDGGNTNYWDLYHFPAEPGDRGWYSTNPRWQQQWYTADSPGRRLPRKRGIGMKNDWTFSRPTGKLVEWFWTTLQTRPLSYSGLLCARRAKTNALSLTSAWSGIITLKTAPWLVSRCATSPKWMVGGLR